MNIFDIVFLATAILYGLAKTATDLRLWHKYSNRIAQFLWRWEPTRRWYEGGNAKYNPSLLGDFWHFMDSRVKIACVLIVGLVAPFMSLSLFLRPVAWYVLFALTFILNYHWLLRGEDADWRRAFKLIFAFWINWFKSLTH